MPKRKSTGSRTLGAELRRRRGARTLQQVSDISKSPPFAERVEPIGVSTLYIIEEGQTMPTLRSLHTLSTIYRVPVQHLVSVLALERYHDLEDGPADTDSARERTLEALAAADYETAFVAALRWEELADGTASRRAATSNKASALWKLGHLDEACLLLLELLADPELPDAQSVRAFTNLAEIFRSKGNLRQALVQAQSGLAIAESCDDARSLAYLLRTRANVRSDAWLWHRAASGAPLDARGKAELREALSDYEESSRLFGDLGFRAEVLFNDISVGQVRCLLGEHREGAQVLERALDDFRDLGHVYGEASALTELGRWSFERGADDRARSLLWAAERLAGPTEHPDLAFLDYYYLMRLEERSSGNTKFFFKKCQRLHPVLETRSPEVKAFESLLAAASEGRS